MNISNHKSPVGYIT